MTMAHDRLRAFQREGFAVVGQTGNGRYVLEHPNGARLEVTGAERHARTEIGRAKRAAADGAGTTSRFLDWMAARHGVSAGQRSQVRANLTSEIAEWIALERPTTRSGAPPSHRAILTGVGASGRLEVVQKPQPGRIGVYWLAGRDYGLAPMALEDVAAAPEPPVVEIPDAPVAPVGRVPDAARPTPADLEDAAGFLEDAAAAGRNHVPHGLVADVAALADRLHHAALEVATREDLALETLATAARALETAGRALEDAARDVRAAVALYDETAKDA